MPIQHHDYSRQVMGRLLLLMSVVILLITLMLFLHNWNEARKELHQQASEWANAIKHDLDTVVEQRAHGLQQTLAVLALNTQLQQALERSDRAQLKLACEGLYTELHNSKSATHFYFIDRSRVALLRLHLPQEHGDLIDRHTLIDAERTLAPAWGIEMGLTGIPTLRVVQPVFIDKQLIGYIELGLEIEYLLESFRPIDEHAMHYAVLLRKDRIQRHGWETGMQMMGRDAHWDHLPNHVIGFISHTWSTNELDQVIANVKSYAEHNDYLDPTSRIWHIQRIPLSDVGDHPMGELLALHDITSQSRRLDRRLAITLLVTLLTLGAALTLITYIMRRSTRLLAMQEQMLRKERDLSQHYLNTVEAIIVSLDKTGHITMINRKGCELLGYQEQGLLGELWFERCLTQPKGMSELYPNYLKTISAETAAAEYLEYPIQPREGEPRLIAWHNAMLHSASGELIGVLITGEDITERHQAEQALHGSEASLRAAQHLARLGSWELDFHNNLLSWSDEVYRIFEIDQDRFTPSYDAFLNAIHPDDRDEVNAAFTNSLQTRRPYAISHRLQMADGRIKHVHEECETTFDETGGPVRSIGTIQDITEQHQAEEALRQSQSETQQLLAESERMRRASLSMLEDQQRAQQEINRLLQAIEQSPEGIAITDTSKVIEYVNDAFTRHTGLGREEALGQQPGCLQAGGHGSGEDKAYIHALLDRGETWKGEVNAQHPDGSEHILATTISPIREHDGTISHYVIILEDITQSVSMRKELERYHTQLEQLVAQRSAQLAESQLKYKTVADFTYNWETWLDPEGRLIYCSPSCERITGYKPEQFFQDLGLLIDITHPDDREALKVHYEHHDALHTHESLSFRITRPDGEVRWLEHTCQAVTGPEGDYLGRRASTYDFTDRWQAEQALQKSQLRYQRLVDDMGNDFLAFSYTAEGTVTYASNSFKQIFGQPKEAIIGKPWADTISWLPEDLARAQIMSGKLIKGEIESFNDEFRFIHPDGQMRTLYITSHLRAGTAGQDLIIDGALTDITASKHNEAQLQKAMEAARAANLAKSQFLANMSHEIRTPMNAIIGLTHLMRRDDITGLQAERLGKIESSAKHLLGIINDILDLSKIEAGKLVLEERDFELGALLDHVSSLISDSALDKGLSIHIEHDESPRWLKGDETRLRQALLNYASNAIKFTQHGSVTLRTTPLAGDETETIIRFEVEDTGIGLTPEQRARIFQAFEQGDASTTRQHGGTGLGLAITSHIAHLMGGEVGLESEPGRGSRFWFTAHLAHGQPRTHYEDTHDDAVEARLRAVAHDVRILLVEDNFINQEVATALLDNVGLSTDCAADGRQAVAMAQRTDYDLILMDMQMPVMGGLEATRAIRQLPEHQTVPILAMTANAFEEDRLACEAAGMDDFISKPVEPEILYTTLFKWLTERHAAAPIQPVTDGQPIPKVPTQDDPEQLLNQLDQLPGLEPRKKVRFLGGQPEKYLKLLRLFIEEHLSDPATIRQHIAAGEQEQAQRLSHTLKGTAGTLGATLLFQAATTLNVALRAETIDSKQIEDCLKEIALELSSIAQIITPSSNSSDVAVADTPRPSPDELSRVLPPLIAILYSGDIRARTLVDQHATTLKALLGKEYRSLTRLVDGFDFEQAAALLSNYRAATDATPGPSRAEDASS